MVHKCISQKSWRLWAVLVALLLSLSAASLGQAVPTAEAAPIDLDLTFAGFGPEGFVTLTEIKTTDLVAVQPDGKIVVVGRRIWHSHIQPQIVVFRFLANGEPDNSFDGDGQVILPINELEVGAAAVQHDGRIVVATLTSADEVTLVRLTADGALDASFGEGGQVNDPATAKDGVALLVQPDGHIVVCTSSLIGGWFGTDYDFVVRRYKNDGARDTTFGGGDGEVTIPFWGEDFCRSVTRQDDGKLVVVGARLETVWPGIGYDWDFAVARLNENGTLDSSFDGDGKLTTGFGDDEKGTDVVIQPDGKIVVIGTSPELYYPHTTYMARYQPDGALDGTFGSGGKLTIPTDELTSLALQSDGKILALGGDGFHVALHRLLPNGTPDTTFDGDGMTFYEFDGEHGENVGMDLAVQPDGRILVASQNSDGAVLVRLWPDGTTFDTGGQQAHRLTFAPGNQPGRFESAKALALLPDGAFLVAGGASEPNFRSGEAFVTRFTADGLPDLSFGEHGTARIRPGVFNYAYAMAVQPDRKIVVAGYSTITHDHVVVDFLVARLNPDGTPDMSFGHNGHTLVNFEGYGADFANALALAPDGKIVVVGNAWNGVNHVWGIARLTPDGQPDATFGPKQDGKVYIDFAGLNSANAVVVQPDGKIIVGGHDGEDLFLVRLRESGEPDPSFGAGGDGYSATDLGGGESINALVLAADGRIYAAGYRVAMPGGAFDGADIVLAQYTPDGLLASCPDPANCQNWPTGTLIVDVGASDHAHALDLREDGQLVAAGCIDGQFAAVQVPTDAHDALPSIYQTDFVGDLACALAVKFSGANQILMAGFQDLAPFNSDGNSALARIETTP